MVPGVQRDMISRLRWRSVSTLLLVAVLSLYALLSVKRSEGKPLWFDELGTLNVATQPTLAGMFRVEPADGNPPLQYLLVRPSVHAFGVNALALRLPAMLGFGLTMVCGYIFVGRRFGAAAGLLVATLLLFSRLSDYGVEARPYALLMGLIALLLVMWQRAAADEQARGAALAGVAASVFALVITQPMGFLWAGVPMAAGEGTRWWQTRRVDRPMLLAIGLGFLGFAVTLFFGRETQQVLSANAGGNHSAIALPTFGKFLQALQVEGLPPALILLVVLGLVAWFSRRFQGHLRTNVGAPEEAPSPSGAPLHEWVAVAAWALTIIAVYLFTLGVTHYFWARYIAPGVAGWFLLVGMLCGTAGARRTPETALVVAIVGAGLILAERFDMVKKTAAAAQVQDSVAPSLLAATDRRGGSEPIVICKPFFYPEIWWYSSPAMRARLHYIADAPHAAETTDFVPEMTLLSMHQAGSTLLPPDSLSGFLAQNRHFLLWHQFVAQGCWLEDYLHAQHYSFTPVASDSSGNETLYEVSALAGAR